MSWVDDVIDDGKAVLRSNDRKAMETFIKNATKRMKFEEVPHPIQSIL